MSTLMTYTVVFKSTESYEKYKKEIVDAGGMIRSEFDNTLGFTAAIPDTIVQLMGNETGIHYFEPDGVVTALQS